MDSVQSFQTAQSAKPPLTAADYSLPADYRFVARPTLPWLAAFSTGIALAVSVPALSVERTEWRTEQRSVKSTAIYAATGEEEPAKPSLPGYAMHLADKITELESFRELQDGWDGPGSRAPGGVLIDTALRILLALPVLAEAPEPFVSADGRVGWFWDNDDKYIAIEVFEGDKFHFYGRRGEMEVGGTEPFDGRSIPSEIGDLIT